MASNTVLQNALQQFDAQRFGYPEESIRALIRLCHRFVESLPANARFEFDKRARILSEKTAEGTEFDRVRKEALTELEGAVDSFRDDQGRLPGTLFLDPDKEQLVEIIESRGGHPEPGYLYLVRSDSGDEYETGAVGPLICGNNTCYPAFIHSVLADPNPLWELTPATDMVTEADCYGQRTADIVNKVRGDADSLREWRRQLKSLQLVAQDTHGHRLLAECHRLWSGAMENPDEVSGFEQFRDYLLANTKQCVREICRTAEDLVSFDHTDRCSDHEMERAKTQKRKLSLVMNVKSGSDLGIGIDEARKLWAVSPCPPDGAKFKKTSAKLLDLNRRQLLAVLELFAESPEGTSVQVTELITALGYAPGGVVSHVEDEVEVIPDDVGQVFRTALDKLRAAMADLSRYVQQQIRVQDWKENWFRKDTDCTF